MQDASMMRKSARILVCFLLLLVLVQGVWAADTYQFVTTWGTKGTDDGQLYYPYGLAISPSGTVYVLDSHNHRIQQFSSTGTFIGKWGSEGTGDGQFTNEPRDITVDPSGNVYVTDPGNSRIQKFSPNGTFLAKWGSHGTGDDQFIYPEGIASDPAGHIYVVDYGNNRVQKFSPAGAFLGKWGSLGTGDGQFSSPTRIAIDSSGNVYVAEYVNNRIQKFSPAGVFLGKWGSYGTGDGQFNYPFGVAVDPSGNVYVADMGNHRIQRFSPDGTFLGTLGSPGTGDGQFYSPFAVALDVYGTVYVADTDNSRIEKFVPVHPTPFVVFSITPPTAMNTGAVNITDITGTGFMYGAGVKLTKTGSPDINATGVTVVPPAKITCTFDLTGKSTGPWNVVVTNPDGTTPTLANGFTVTAEPHPLPPPLSVTGVSPSSGTNDQSIPATVTGTGFKPGAVVRLTRAGQPDIVASGVTLAGNSTITCTFDLNGKATGTWDLAVSNPGDGTTSVRSAAFSLTTLHRPTVNGTIIVSSIPQDTLVYLDGILKGTGSLLLPDVSPGSHSVRVTKTLYNDYGTDVQVAAGSVSYVNAELTPASGTIFAMSNPVDATVSVDGIVKGISPATIPGISPGSHTVSFSKSGYRDESRTTTVSSGQTSEISVELQESGWDWLNPIVLIIIAIIVLILVIIVALLRKKKNRWENY